MCSGRLSDSCMLMHNPDTSIATGTRILLGSAFPALDTDMEAWKYRSLHKLDRNRSRPRGEREQAFSHQCSINISWDFAAVYRSRTCCSTASGPHVSMVAWWRKNSNGKFHRDCRSAVDMVHMVTIWLQIFLYGVEVTFSDALFLPHITENISHSTRETEDSNNSCLFWYIVCLCTASHLTHTYHTLKEAFWESTVRTPCRHRVWGGRPRVLYLLGNTRHM